eukprot:COSAG05_NODE_272_length_12454_cov_1460.218085_12_plen_213_part_00
MRSSLCSRPTNTRFGGYLDRTDFTLPSRNIQLHHTKMFIKPPQIGAPFPMHQDVPYFEHEKHSMLAAVVHFDASTVEKGCIRVIPGSFKQGPIPHIGQGGHHLEATDFPVSEATPCEAAAGDVLFFSYLCVHGSMPNRHPTESRTSVLVQMRDPADKSTRAGAGNTDLYHNSRGQGMMLRGVDPTCSSGKSVVGDLPVESVDGGGDLPVAKL